MSNIETKNENENNTHTENGVYFDHAGATPTSAAVLDAMHEVEHMYANPSGIYADGVIVKDKIDDSRETVASILNCRPYEVYFTGSGTESINLALSGLVKSYYINKKVQNSFKPVVITTPIEHTAVLETLKHLQQMGLIEIQYINIKETGAADLNHFKKLLYENDNVILVSVMYVNNETGVVQPVKEIGRMIDIYNQDRGNSITNSHTDVVYHIDAMQAANYLDIDTRKLRVHMMSLNGSKIYGPKGVGVLYKSEKVKIEPILYGGAQERGLRSGTPDVVKIVGLAEALRETTNMQSAEVKRLTKLKEYFIEKIKLEIPEVKIWGSEKEENSIDKNLHSTPNIINIGLKGMQSDEMVIRLSEMGYSVSHKSSCSANDDSESYVLTAMGATPTEGRENIRISMGRSTTQAQINRLIEAIKEIYYKFRVL
jgi:cysteine desulfurase